MANNVSRGRAFVVGDHVQVVSGEHMGLDGWVQEVLTSSRGISLPPPYYVYVVEFRGVDGHAARFGYTQLAIIPGEEQEDSLVPA